LSTADSRQARFTITLTGPRVVFGELVAHTELGTELDLLNARRVLLFSSEREGKTRADILAPIADRIVGHFSDVRRHVPVAVAQAATSLARDVQADCLLTIGGGSAVGTAKAVALETGLPIMALPTTYAGSEVTPVYGMTDNGAKRTGRSDLVLPKTVLLDPTLTWDLPPDLTRYSAINALAHCVSGLFATGRSPVTDLLATEGARLLTQGLRGATASTGDPAARADLTRGAYLAGTVLAHAGTSAHHTICHILGGAFDLPHAETHTAVLPAASAFLQERDPRAAEPLARVLGAASLATGFRELVAEVGGATRLRDIGLTQTDLSRAAGLLAGTGPHTGIPGMTAVRASQLLAEAW
jgi:maleylacetate reductase